MGCGAGPLERQCSIVNGPPCEWTTVVNGPGGPYSKVENVPYLFSFIIGTYQATILKGIILFEFLF